MGHSEYPAILSRQAVNHSHVPGWGPYAYLYGEQHPTTNGVRA